MITLHDLCHAIGGQLFGDPAASEFTSIACRPTDVSPGCLYALLPLNPVEGRRQMEAAIAGGAAGLLSEHPPPGDTTGITVVLVGSVLAALSQWAAYALRQQEIAVVGVAEEEGTAAARTAAAAVLSARYRTLMLEPTVPGLSGFAVALSRLEPSTQVVILSLPAQTGPEVDEILMIAPPHLAIIPPPAGARASAAASAARRATLARMIEGLAAGGGIIFWAADETAREGAAASRIAGLTYDMGGGPGAADLVGVNVRYFADKTAFDLLEGGRRHKGHWTPLLGRPGLLASLAGLAAGAFFGIPMEQGLRALRECQPLPGMLTLLDGVGGLLLIDATANAGPVMALDSLSLLSAPDLTDGRRVFVLGDLEDDAAPDEADYRTIGEQAANCDLVVACGKHAATALKAARSVGLAADRAVLAFRPEDAANAVLRGASPEDGVVVIGGRRGRMERVCARLLADPADRGRLARRSEESEVAPAGLRSWVEIDLDALANNVKAIRQRIGPEIQIMAVVSANAYGHDAVMTAATALHNGAALLAVSSPAEVSVLRDAGIGGPILVTGAVSQETARSAALQDAAISLYDRDQLPGLAAISNSLPHRVRVHIRVDTGLGHLGLLPEDVAPIVREIVRQDALVLEGLCTDFAEADQLLQAARTREQLERFEAVARSLQATGIDIPYVHAANSPALFTLPGSLFNTVRPGAALYGLDPSPEVACPSGFRPVLSWKTRVAQVRSLPEDWGVGFGRAYRTRGPERIAILPIGFADGLPPSMAEGGEVLIGGQRAPLVGRIGMNTCAAQVSLLPEIQAGDEVVLIGQQGDQTITAEEAARAGQVTNLALLACIPADIPRVVR